MRPLKSLLPSSEAQGKPTHWASVTASVVAVGGAVGALARYAASAMWPNGTDAHLMWRVGEAELPWTTLLINAVGCFLMGVLAVSLKKHWSSAPPLLSPLLGTGVLGGFTTFSSYTDDFRRLIENGQPGIAAGYLILTVAAALMGVVMGAGCARALPPRRSREGGV